MDMESWRPYWVSLVNKCEDQGYENLSDDERIWYNIRILIDSVNNGGLISFYYNYGADHLIETIEDLSKLKAEKIIEILEKVRNLFPDEKPSKNIDERNKVINSWEDHDKDYDNLLEEVDHQFYELEEELEKKINPIIKRILENSKFEKMEG